MTINATIVQDAYHYALAAMGGSRKGLESSFSGRNADYSRGQYMKLAYQTAKKAGLDVDRPKRLADVAEMVEYIEARCTHQGVDPFTGEKLCLGCKVIGAGDIDGGLCWDCRAVKRSSELAAIAAKRARLQAALVALDARVGAISGAAKHTGCCFLAGVHGSAGGATSPCWCGHGERPVAVAVLEAARTCCHYHGTGGPETIGCGVDTFTGYGSTATAADGIDAVEDRAHARAMSEAPTCHRHGYPGSWESCPACLQNGWRR